MSHTYIHSDFHCIFSTKERRPFLKSEHRQRLFPYIAATAAAKGMTALSVGGMENHVHLLLSLPGTMALSNGMQLIKGNSSHWIGETFPELSDFAWQQGFAAFSVSASNLASVREYIENQEEHHKQLRGGVHCAAEEAQRRLPPAIRLRVVPSLRDSDILLVTIPALKRWAMTCRASGAALLGDGGFREGRLHSIQEGQMKISRG